MPCLRKKMVGAQVLAKSVSVRHIDQSLEEERGSPSLRHRPGRAAGSLLRVPATAGARAAGRLPPVPLAVLDDHRLQSGKLVQRFEAFLASMTGLLHAAEGQFDTATGTIGINVDLSGLDLPRDP